MNQLNNVEISIVKPLGLDGNTNQSRVNLQSDQDQNEKKCKQNLPSISNLSSGWTPRLIPQN
jgi:hypothetical protein